VDSTLLALALAISWGQVLDFESDYDLALMLAKTWEQLLVVELVRQEQLLALLLAKLWEQLLVV